MGHGAFVAAAVLGCAVAAAAGQTAPTPFDPLPGAQRERYRMDFRKNFYADDASWRADVERAKALAGEVEARRGHLLESAASLLDVLDRLRDSEDLLLKLYAYGEFTSAVDTRNRRYLEAYEVLRAEFDAKTSFFKVELRGLDAARLEAFLKAAPRLAGYRFTLDDTLRWAPHTLSEKEESLLASLGPSLEGWPPALFQLDFDRTAFPQVAASGKTLDVHRDYETLLRDPDRSVRERAFRAYYKSLREISDVAGFALLKGMQARNAEAALRGFPTYYHQALFDAYLSRPELDNLYGQIEAQLPLYREYQELRAARLQRDLGVPRAEIWDQEMPPAGAPQPRFTGDEACRLGIAALSPLGPEYARELNRLLDPANGRLDIAGGPNRGQGAFCEGNFAYFMDNYQGYLNDVATLVHESGHAIHHQLVLNHRGSLYYSYGPAYMTESFATFNEWLLRDHLLRTAKDAALKRAVRNESLNEMMLLWEIARRAKFEMVAYDRVGAGQITDARGFDQACEEVGRSYDPAFDRYLELEVHWMRKHHYWTVPGYYFNYVVAHMLALKYYQLYQADPAGFSKRYTAMMAQGFDRPAAALLKDFLKIDLRDPRLLEGTFAMMRAELARAPK